MKWAVVDVLVVDPRAELGLAREKVGGVDGAGRRAVHRVERVVVPERFERRDHAGGDDPAHGAAFDASAMLAPSPWGRGCRARRAPERPSTRERSTDPRDHFEDALRHLDVHAELGLSTSCVIATWPAMLTS